jgi:UDP-N-acetylmuramate dehydrogenase
MKIHKKTNLSDLTTIKLGGEAKLYVECNSVEHIQESLNYVKDNNLSTCILAGGSNIIFPDKGFDGLVIKIDLKGVEFKDKEDTVLVTASAGENWDMLVQEAIKKNLTGIESLSGIPGSVGATPIQNVGAYGQEVSDVIVEVHAIDRKTTKEIVFANKECEFGYRTSRFKTIDKGKYIVTKVVYELHKNAKPKIEYDQLKQKLKQVFGTIDVTNAQVREAVLELRKQKSMIIDPIDPNSRSVGSFFTNPVVSIQHYKKLKRNINKDIPAYKDNDMVKIPAAWLIEQAGFRKGLKYKQAAISENHSLALVNRGTSTKDILDLAYIIQQGVYTMFGIKMEFEPEII